MRDSIRREQLTSRSEVRLVTDEARHQVIALWDGVHQPDTRIAVKDRMTIEDGLIKDFEVISLVHRKAAEPKPEPAPVLTGDAEAVAPLIEALRDVARHVWSLPYATSSDVARRNTESYLAGLFSQAWSFSQQIEMLGVPYFSRGAKVEGLPGLYNPDNIYSSALLDPTGAYRIYGRRGSHTDLSFQVVDQYPILGLGENLAVIRPDTAAAKPGDEFEFYLGGTERDGENWHPMPDHAVAILARQTFGDWRAVPTSLHIERLDRPVPRAHENAFAQAASGLRQAARLWVDGYVPGLERSTMTNALPALKPAVTDKGGLGGQTNVMARYRINSDKVLLITVRKSDAAYQGIQLGDPRFVTPNPIEHQVSLNTQQALIDDDGMIRFVISLDDPGVPNWLDPAGNPQGYIFMRWQGIETPLSAGDAPVARLLPRADLRKALPDNTPKVSPADRQKQLAGRKWIPQIR